jgi:hypothetical protein
MKSGVLERGDFTNKDTGIVVNFGSVGIRDSVAYAQVAVKRGMLVESKLSALYKAREFIENAVCFDSQISEYNPKTVKGKSPNTLFMHRMYGVFSFENEYYLANLAIEESYESEKSTGRLLSTQNRLYNLKDIKITLIGDSGLTPAATLSNDNGESPRPHHAHHAALQRGQDMGRENQEGQRQTDLHDRLERQGQG